MDKEYREEKQVYNFEDKVFEFSDCIIQPGQYDIPIQFVLPANLPTSFEHQWHTTAGKCIANVSYTVEVMLIGMHNKKKIIDRKTLFINQPPLQKTHGDAKELTQKMKSCYCFSRGELKMKAYSEKNNYTCGEQVWMVAECINKMNKPVRGVFADFVRTITVTAEGYTKTLYDTQSGFSGGMIGQEEAKIGQNAIRVSVSTGNTLEKTPECTRYSTTCKGTLVQCEYAIQARFVPDICCNCDPEPIISFPVCMIIPQVKNRVQHLGGWSNDRVEEFKPYIVKYYDYADHVNYKNPTVDNSTVITQNPDVRTPLMYQA